MSDRYNSHPCSINCSRCQSNPCCCSIEYNPTNTNTFNPTIHINPVFNVSSFNGNGGNGDLVQTVTSGPLFRNANTDFIQVSALNLSNHPQTVTISVLNWQNTCDEEEFPKFGFLCGEIVNEPDGENPITVQNGPIFTPPVGFIPVLTPFTFIIPARQLFSVQVYPPDPVLPPNPIYEVQVTFPTDPIYPSDPIRVNTWGIDGFGVIQAGNTVLHHQFTRLPIDPV